MIFDIIEHDDCLEYQIRNVPESYREILLHFFFTEDHEGFNRTYLKTDFMFAHDTHLLRENFGTCLEEMIHHFMEKQSMNWEHVLERTIQRFETHQIQWWLTGSAACAVRGIPISPHDIDLMTYKTETMKIKHAFHDVMIEPFRHVSGWFVKGFGVTYIEGGRVDFAFDPEATSDDHGKMDFGCYAASHLETIRWKDYEVLVPPVELHLPSNKIRNRTERVELIEQYMKDNALCLN